eukprot:179262-Pyramimonas_sp.AAC.1
MCPLVYAAPSNSPGGNASEQMNAAPVLARFLQLEGRDCPGPDVVHSGVRLCEVAALLSIVNTGLVCPEELQHAVVSHLTAQQQAWGTS